MQVQVLGPPISNVILNMKIQTGSGCKLQWLNTSLTRSEFVGRRYIWHFPHYVKILEYTTYMRLCEAAIGHLLLIDPQYNFWILLPFKVDISTQTGVK